MCACVFKFLCNVYLALSLNDFRNLGETHHLSILRCWSAGIMQADKDGGPDGHSTFNLGCSGFYQFFLNSTVPCFCEHE